MYCIFNMNYETYIIMFSDKDIFFLNIKLEKEEESMYCCICIIKCSILDC